MVGLARRAPRGSCSCFTEREEYPVGIIGLLVVIILVILLLRLL